MGIQGLTKLLTDNAGDCLKEGKVENYFGRKVAVDASMQIYSFMIVVGRTGDQQLTDESGNVTSHLQGMFFRTTRMLEAGMKPIFVFDGKPPQLKSDELSKRFSRKAEATEDLQIAKESGTAEEIEKFSKRTVRVSREQTAECKRLLTLMGVPVLDAPSEAEAQCAELAKKGIVYGVSTEDMDALTFGTPRLIRNLMVAASQNKPVLEIDLAKALEGLGLTQEQFVDLGILCGCDYTDKIAGIGPTRALQLIKKHGSLEAILASLDREKFRVPDPFPYEEARKLFHAPDVIPAEEASVPKWTAPDQDGLIDFLVKEKNFNEDRIRAAITRIVSAKNKSTQGRLDSFFSSVAVKAKEAPEKATGKRKPGAALKVAPKKGKLGGFGKKK